ncbi:MAG: glycosyltransferase 87 family protein [Candidatus Baltobacteraceae bacterium]|jgi:hypothetical protein
MLNVSGRIRLGQAAALLCAGGLAWLAALWLGQSRWLRTPIDFVAFYCGGRTTALGFDPYLAGPLRACENVAAGSVGVHVARYLVVPAPLPPYALALLAPLGLLPFATARTLWFAALLLASGATVVLLRRLARLPLPLVALCVLSADAFPSLVIGQIVPLVVALLAGAAVALQAGRPRLAAVLVACTLAEPHVGLPACLSLFVWERRARTPLLAALAALGLVSLAGGGIARSLEYGFAVLPAHARAEGLEFSGQYSLSALLAQLGVANGLALELGSLSYLAMTALGVWAAGRLADLLEEPGTLVLAAPAFALLGGIHVHIHQMAVALPLALLLLSRCRSQRLVLALALGLLAVPWQTLVDYGLIPTPPPLGSRASAEATMARVREDGRLAEDVWGIWVRSGVHDGRTPLGQAAVKLPTWLALGAILATAAGLSARRGRRRSVTQPERLAAAR